MVGISIGYHLKLVQCFEFKTIFFFDIFSAPKVYKSTNDYVTGLYNLKVTSRCAKKDAGTSMHREQHLDLTEKYVYFDFRNVCGPVCVRKNKKMIFNFDYFQKLQRSIEWKFFFN